VHILEQARLAEDVGLDLVVFEDALIYKGDPQSAGVWGNTQSAGVWEAMAIAAALAASTTSIAFGPSVINAPYRSAAHLAKIAETIDEISNGRFILGLGAGNTEDSDYAAFGFPTDHRYSRFAEAIVIIHSLLRTGAADFTGQFHSAKESELVMRGPRPNGPPIVIAAAGPKMLQLTARYADGWNWWTAHPSRPTPELASLVDSVAAACIAEDRDPSTLERSIDLYSLDPHSIAEPSDGDSGPLRGSPAEIADRLSKFDALGFKEARCDLVTDGSHTSALKAIEALGEAASLLR
jgi:alkanesulfonate monooxygenase SsuD/methylene tetrahydromethanopterin reductase-like flavin-dependent oxidoreductase (luciferase family)